MDEAEIKSHLTTTSFGQTVFAFSVLDSTNSKAKALVSDGVPDGTVVIADQQTAGRGRLGRTWISESGQNLTFSLIIRPAISPSHIGILSLYAGVAVASGLKNLTGKSPTCKWPNDVLFVQKKCCGILSETVFSGTTVSAVIIGIGVNVNQAVFPEILSTKATSLFLTCGKPFDRSVVLAELLKQLEEYYTYIQSGMFETIIDNWKRYSHMLGSSITVDQDGEVLHGTATRLADDGGLIISSEGKEVKVRAGDVTVIL